MTFFNILMIIMKFVGALAVFLFAMKLMSEGLQKTAGSKMRHVLGKITDRPLNGILTGTIVTAAIQSSSATTVMVVSFVNAGLLSLAGAVAVIMGANIGTTVTAWIITLFGLGEGSGVFSLPLFLSMVSLFFFNSKNDTLKSVGQTIIGLALLLFGMELLQSAMPNLEEYPDFLQTLASMSDWGFWSILVFVGIGALLTCLVQASAAMMAITLVMCYNGWIGFDVAVALVMGQNIGTTITAILAATVANTAGKKASRAHLVFNLFGVLLTLIIFRPLMNGLADVTTSLCGCSPYADPTDPNFNKESIPLAISLFHTVFNVGNTLVLAWFIPQILKVVNWMVKDEGDGMEEEYHLTYIEGSLLSTAELNIQTARREIQHFSEDMNAMYSILPELRTAKKRADFDEVESRIARYEERADRMELEITNFLTRLGSGDLSQHGSERITSMLRMVDNLESIGDTIFQIALTRKNKLQESVHFDEAQNANLDTMTQLVQRAFDVMQTNLSDFDHVDMKAAYEAEQQINDFRDRLRLQHFESLREGRYGYAIGNAYSSLYALYEKLGDYIINVSESLDSSMKHTEVG
ncbi:MAG: Na/Pi cotransporter family protein [Bacteroidales bacterium]|nr:Na/Pi cotransporter family protein [Bacteroidales bacterium]